MNNFFSLYNPLFYILMTMALLVTVVNIVVKRLIIPLNQKHLAEKREIALVNEKLLSLFTTLSPDPVFRFDREGIIIMTNAAGNAINSGRRVIGQHIRQVFPDIRDIDINTFINNSSEYSFDTSIASQSYSLKLKGIPELNAGHIYCTNITERKQAEKALIAAKEKAEEMDRLKTSFLANMSHELRTPLTGILGYSEALREDMEPGAQRDFVEVINSSGMRLLETINLILDLSKIQSEKLEVNLSEFDLIAEIKEVINLYRHQAAKKNLKFNFASEIASLPGTSDQRLMSQIIANLVNNAIKYTPQGFVEVTASVLNTNETRWLSVSVQDSGIGIATEKQPIIWDAFRQVSEGYGRYFEGTGLGLTITKNFIEALGGKISLVSELGRGSNFTVLIPF